MDKIEKAFAPFAIQGLIRYVVALNALVFLLVQVNPDFLTLIHLDRAEILSGQVWRLVSWIFIPPNASPLFLLIALIFMWFLGEVLEGAWGTVRLNLYYLVGMIGTTLAALIFGASSGNVALNLSILFAVGTVAPNLEVLLFFIIPVKIKWIAIFSVLYPLYLFVVAPIPIKAITLMCFANYLIFFGPGLVRRFRERKEISARRAKFEAATVMDAALHRCAVCGRTEVSDPDLDFRVAADGQEYCTGHLPRRGS